MKYLLIFMTALFIHSGDAQGQQQLLEGYNMRYDLMYKVYNNPAHRQQLINALKKLPPEKKVLRYPGGTVVQKYRYNEKQINQWIDFCREAGVTMQTYVWSLKHEDDAMRALKKLCENFKIVCIEIGNEEDIEAELEAGIYKGRVNSTQKLADEYYIPKGKEYGHRFNEARKTIRAEGFEMPVAAGLAAAVNYKGAAWNKGVVKTAKNLTDIVVHEYWKWDKENFIEVMDAVMEPYKDLNKWYTEFNILLTKDWPDWAYTDKHIARLIKYRAHVAKDPTIKLLQIHGLTVLPGAGRWRMYRDKLNDKYPGY